MRMLSRNMQKVVVKSFYNRKKLYNDEGKFTGEYEDIYEERTTKATIVDGSNRVVRDLFGENTEFAAVMYSKEAFSPTYRFEIERFGEVREYRIEKPKQHQNHFVYGLVEV